jgi:hypothetical protein
MLLNKAELNLAKLASKEESRYALQGIAVQPKHTVVTNGYGHYLVAVTHCPLANAEETFPATSGLEHKKLEEGKVSETVLLSTSAALGASKALLKKTSIPVLALAALGTDKTVYVNSLDAVQTFKSDATGTFPRWEGVVPTGKPKADIVVNAEYLENLAKYIRENGGDLPMVRLTVYDNSTALRLDAKTREGQDIMGLIMPIRYDFAAFAKRPDQLKAEKPKESKTEETTKV